MKKKCTSVETQYMNTFPKMFFLKVKLNLDGIMKLTISGSSKLPTLHYLQRKFFFHNKIFLKPHWETFQFA